MEGNILNMAREKLASIEKDASSFRDAVALGRTPLLKGARNIFDSFNQLRNTKMYKSFADYQKMKGLDKATYKQGLIDDLKSILRGSGKKGTAPNQFKDFMSNQFKGDFTEQQYNKFFGSHRTHYPSLEQMSDSIIKGVNNKLDRLGVPHGDIEGLLAQAKSKRVSESGLKKILEDKVQAGLGGVTGIVSQLSPDKPTVIVDSPTRRLREAKLLNHLTDEVIDNPSNKKALEALLLSHEGNGEAESMLKLFKTMGVMDALNKHEPMTKTLLGQDSHISGSVLGKELLTANKLYGSQAGSPMFAARVTQNVPKDPVKALNNEYGPGSVNSLLGQMTGLDFSSQDGGLSKFKNVRQFKSYLNKVDKNTKNLIRDYRQGVTDDPEIAFGGIRGQDSGTFFNKLLNKYFPNTSKDYSEIADLHYDEARKLLNDYWMEQKLHYPSDQINKIKNTSFKPEVSLKAQQMFEVMNAMKQFYAQNPTPLGQSIDKMRQQYELLTAPTNETLSKAFKSLYPEQEFSEQNLKRALKDANDYINGHKKLDKFV